MDPEISILREVCQKKKDNTMGYHLYVNSKIWHKWTDLSNRNRLTENRPVVAKWSGEGCIGNLGFANYCGSAGKESACNAGDLGLIPGFDPWVGKIPWRRERLPTSVFWPGEFHGLYSPWGGKESDTTERLSLITDTDSRLKKKRFYHIAQGTIFNILW